MVLVCYYGVVVPPPTLLSPLPWVEAEVDGDDDTEEALEVPVIAPVPEPGLAPVPVPVPVAVPEPLPLPLAVAAPALLFRKNCRKVTMEDGRAMADAADWGVFGVALGVVGVFGVVLGVVGVVGVALGVVVLMGVVGVVVGVDRWAKIALKECCWLRMLVGVKALPVVLVVGRVGVEGVVGTRDERGGRKRE